jgi:RND family efflux transporter MFP subunit
LKSSLGRMKTEYDVARSRLETLRRSRDLAKGEYDRVKTLLHQDDVGTQSGVDNAEMAFNQANDAFDQLSQAVELYPMRINEAASALDSAEAQLDLAKTRLERTEVRALFDARVKEKQVELGQYVAPGAPVLTLANDAVLEISVSLDSRDARSWLQFDGDHSPNDSAWFGQIARVPCRISWTEDTGKHYWQGTLDRVEQFDQTTRTLTVAVRVDSPDALSGEDRFPLVDGMFCQVDIPGATLKQVYRLPRWAVSFEGQAYVAEDKHLKTRDVEVVRSQGEESFVSQGLSPGDLVVTTRLVNPLPNSLLDFTLDEAPAASQKAQAGGEPAASAETSS